MILAIGGDEMINNIDYTKLAMSYQHDKAEIDPTLRSQVWGSLLVGLSVFWCIVALFIWIIS
ncbi:TPA: YmiA family putative membrane protein [Klebsiella aerogenes]|nr:YmiA family putative membrane protein [Klebsiella aerogenes]SAJ07861.1 protein YmiA [Klebsiella aerogenes]HBT2489677.1 YmiA family putative membrane protein [Klebsiella aerogenes]HBT2500102.1 YmiA family putative membrane protein [Klebsiella aerogenes]